jgi:circadian clock protein KaiC
VVVDPLSAFRGPPTDVHATLLRMMDLLKARGITGLFTSLTRNGELADGTDIGLSSLMDAWIKLLDIEANGERSRTLYVIKSRGMSHSNQVREYRITDAGVVLVDVYVGPEGVLTGTARLTQEAKEKAAARRRQEEVGRRRREIARRREAIERQIAELQATLQTEEDETTMLIAEDDAHEDILVRDSASLAARRGAAE